MKFTDHDIEEAKRIIEKLRKETEEEIDVSKRAWNDYRLANTGCRYVCDGDLRQLELRADRCQRAREESEQNLKSAEEKYIQFLAEVEAQKNEEKYGKPIIESVVIWHDPQILEPSDDGPFLVMIDEDDFIIGNYKKDEKQFYSDDDGIITNFTALFYARVVLPNAKITKGSNS